MSDGSGGAPQLDEQALEAAIQAVHASPGDIREEVPVAIRAYLAASPGAGELDLTTKEETMDSIPLTYVYLAQVQAASKALSRAMEAMSDQAQDGGLAAIEIGHARRAIENVYKLHAEGVTS